MSSRKYPSLSGIPLQAHAAPPQLSPEHPRRAEQEDRRHAQQHQPSHTLQRLHEPLTYQQLFGAPMMPQQLALPAIQYNIFSPTHQPSSDTLAAVLPERHAAAAVREGTLDTAPESARLRYPSVLVPRRQLDLTQSLLDSDSSLDSDTEPDTANDATPKPSTPLDEYDTWTADAIRKECTRRGLKDVHVVYVTVYPVEHVVNALEFSHDFFVGIDPSTVKAHSSKKLHGTWKEVNRYYIVAEKKFTSSGQHEKDFPNFVDNRGFVLYLRKWLGIKPELYNFVKSGMLDRDQLDTLDDNASTIASSASSATTPSKSKVREAQSLDSLAASFATYIRDRRREVERANASSSKQLQEKSSILAMLGDIRRQLADVDRELAHGDGSSLQRLEEDRHLLLHERQGFISKLREHDQ
ncbi:hypothetical protein PHYPSEUDO_007571 [Phytophthora pseudosyringae]|uniref:Uncharacterized protein n=1 Tax=Phytophthora pseudosyringae TaxID=221518 RepID=A0A8T1VGR5_9STRA|nr:hypothetical protein PHYPSEUDO_007571 [Phytophthora pseudosyringae]